MPTAPNLGSRASHDTTARPETVRGGAGRCWNRGQLASRLTRCLRRRPRAAAHPAPPRPSRGWWRQGPSQSRPRRRKGQPRRVAAPLVRPQPGHEAVPHRALLSPRRRPRPRRPLQPRGCPPAHRRRQRALRRRLHQLLLAHLQLQLGRRRPARFCLPCARAAPSGASARRRGPPRRGPGWQRPARPRPRPRLRAFRHAARQGCRASHQADHAGPGSRVWRLQPIPRTPATHCWIRAGQASSVNDDPTEDARIGGGGACTTSRAARGAPRGGCFMSLHAGPGRRGWVRMARLPSQPLAAAAAALPGRPRRRRPRPHSRGLPRRRCRRRSVGGRRPPHPRARHRRRALPQTRRPPGRPSAPA
jgi:hypothetical protein